MQYLAGLEAGCKLSSAREFLADQISRNPEVLNQAWAHDEDRWNEVVYCVLDQIHRIEPQVTRNAVGLASALQLLAPAKLIAPSDSERTVFRHVLSLAGWEAEETNRALALLGLCATALTNNGRLHQLLQAEASALHARVLARFDPKDRSGVASAMAHWIQNTCHLPAQIDDAQAERFAKNAGFSFAALAAAAEEMGLNLALLDDLIRSE